MDSLLSTYASSSDEEEDYSSTHPHRTNHHQPPQLLPSSSSSSSSLFSTLPKPQLSSPSLFTAIPPPKSNQTPNPPLPPSLPKRVVQFHPPKPSKPLTNPNQHDSDDEDEDRQSKKKRYVAPSPDVKSFLSSIPAPKNSGPSAGLGSGAASSGLGSRRSVIDAATAVSVAPAVEAEDALESGVVVSEGAEVYDHDVGYANYANSEMGYANAGENQQFNDYVGGVSNSNDWYNNSGNVSAVGAESFVSMSGGRRRKDQPPMEILEVRQDELMKNRPTEDKSKLTGMAFGPSYQPASSKGKPNKLSKRKHQIGSLYFDMKQKEMELAERRSKGLLTKAETQAKYGW